MERPLGASMWCPLRVPATPRSLIDVGGSPRRSVPTPPGLPRPAYGDYSLDLILDDRPVKTITLTTAASQTAAPGAPGDAQADAQQPRPGGA